MRKNAHIEPTPAAQKDEDARNAQALKDNPMFLRALDEIEEMYTAEWKRTEGPHADMRERAYFMVRTIERLRQHINEYVTNGKLNPSQPKAVMKEK